MLVTWTGQRNFYGTIREVKNANHKLFQCQKSYLINPDNGVSLDKKRRDCLLCRWKILLRFQKIHERIEN